MEWNATGLYLRYVLFTFGTKTFYSSEIHYSGFLRWSLGAIMYEMLVGYPPFYSDEPMSTCRKVKINIGPFAFSLQRQWRSSESFNYISNMSFFALPGYLFLVENSVCNKSSRLWLQISVFSPKQVSHICLIAADCKLANAFEISRRGKTITRSSRSYSSASMQCWAKTRDKRCSWNKGILIKHTEFYRFWSILYTWKDQRFRYLPIDLYFSGSPVVHRHRVG